MKNDDARDLEAAPPRKRVSPESGVTRTSGYFAPRPNFAKMRKTVLRLIRLGEKGQLEELINRIGLPQQIICQFFEQECGTFFYAGLSNSSNLDMLNFLLDKAMASEELKQIFIKELKNDDFFILLIFADVQKAIEESGEDLLAYQQLRIEKIKILCQIDMATIMEFRQICANDMTDELKREFDFALQETSRQLHPVNT